MDVAEALNVMMTAPVTSTASTFALPGPKVHTFNSLQNLVSAMTMKPVSSAPTLPKPIATMLATMLNRGLWWPTVSPDEIERKYIDDFGVDAMSKVDLEAKPAGWELPGGPAKMVGIDGEAVKSWGELDIYPDQIEEHAIKYLRRYRSAYVSDPSFAFVATFLCEKGVR